MLSVEERFWSKVDKAGNCWNWTASKVPGGYGAFRLDGRLERSHRVSYRMVIGPIPDGMFVDHICHNPSCVRPIHLRLATNKQNSENLGVVRSRSGIRGVTWHKRLGKWMARVHHHGKTSHLGYFSNREDAEAVATAKRNELFTHNNLDRKGMFIDTPADNIAALRQWHERNHHSDTWATCVHSPCNVTTTTFRKNWDTK